MLNRAQAQFCRAQNKKSRKPALLKAPFPHFLLGWVQGEIVWRVKPRTAANLWHYPIKTCAHGAHTAIIHYYLFIKAKVPLSRHFCKYISPNRSCRKEKWRWYRFSAARSIAEQPPSGFRAFGCGHRVRVCRRVRLSCFRQSGACRHHRGGA